MSELYPVAKLRDRVLIINKDDLAFVGKERAFEVKCVQVDLHYQAIDPVLELEKHLKFNPWEEIGGDERAGIIQQMRAVFSEQEIQEKITRPLTENRMKPLSV